jgi:hypothetical protein
MRQTAGDFDSLAGVGGRGRGTASRNPNGSSVAAFAKIALVMLNLFQHPSRSRRNRYRGKVDAETSSA